MRYDLAEARREQKVEATKLLEHIAKLETEKELLTSQIEEERQKAKNHNENSLLFSDTEQRLRSAETKYTSIEAAYKQLKDKHLKLVETHASLLRSASNEKDQIKTELLQKVSREEAVFQKFKSAVLDAVVEHGVRLVADKKMQIGTESVEARISSLKAVTTQLDEKIESEIHFPVSLAFIASQLTDLAGFHFYFFLVNQKSFKIFFLIF